MLPCKRKKIISNCFHIIIITSIYAFLMMGCGYKTPPKYTAQDNLEAKQER